MKLDILKKSLENNELIGIRTEKIDWDELIIGFITNLNQRKLTINEIDKYGFLIGNTEIEIKDILNIVVNDRYQKRLLFLHNNRNLLSLNDRKTIWIKGVNIANYFNLLIKNKKIVTLFFYDDNYATGIIKKFDKSYVMIKAIGEEGDDDGISYYPLDDIIGLRYDSIEEQKIKLLHDNINNFY